MSKTAVNYFLSYNFRYYKTAIPQESGWNVDVAEWCKSEADRQGLQEADRWGCFIIDEIIPMNDG